MSARDDFNLRVERPAGITDERWAAMKSRLAAEAAPVVSEVLGVCIERSWCNGVAGTGDHDEYHASMTIDLVDSADPARCSAAAAYLVENRSDGRVRLAVDIDGELLGHARLVELDVLDARALLHVTIAGASENPGADARQRMLDLLAEVTR